jgi:lysophospholipase L1-like esterase
MLALHATATSGLPVTLSSITPNNCIVSGAIATFLQPEPCQIQASQSGDSRYLPAPALIISISVTDPTTPAVLAIQNLLPKFVIAGSDAQDVTITGTGFGPETVAMIDGTPHPMTYVNPAEILIPLTTLDQAALRVHIISLINPGPTPVVVQITLPVLKVPSGMIELSQLEVGNQARLQRLIQKGRTGQPVTIVGIGGSITLGGGVTNRIHRYFDVLGDWWRGTFPSSLLTMIDSGYAGAGSDYGAVRTPRDALAYNPDLVIVEFAVNDQPLGPAVYDDTYEGLVRQLLDAPSHPAVILLFMMRYGQPFATSVNSAEPWQKLIGAHYNVPMVSYYDAMTPELVNGDIPLSQLSLDNVHPNDLGHAYAALYLESALQNTIDTFLPGATPDSIQPANAPLYSDHFEYTSLADGTGKSGPQLAPTSNHGWGAKGALTDPTIGQPDAGFQTSLPGSTLDFKVNGTDIVLGFWRVHGPVGQISVTVDGGHLWVIDAWTTSGTGGFHAEARIGAGLAQGNHYVHVELLPTHNSGSAGTTFRIVSIGTGGTPTRYMSPEKPE